MKADPRRFDARENAIRELRGKCVELGWRLMDASQAYYLGYCSDDDFRRHNFYIKQYEEPGEILAKGSLEEVQEFVERCKNLKAFL